MLVNTSGCPALDAFHHSAPPPDPIQGASWFLVCWLRIHTGGLNFTAHQVTDLGSPLTPSAEYGSAKRGAPPTLEAQHGDHQWSDHSGSRQARAGAGGG